jgi:uncharacterized protein (DUF2249 family)
VTDIRILDVRLVTCNHLRRELIFETFQALDSGAAFELVDDHDPRPLFYEFAAARAGDFTWDRLEQGPDVWRVRIGRTAAARSGS